MRPTTAKTTPHRPPHGRDERRKRVRRRRALHRAELDLARAGQPPGGTVPD